MILALENLSDKALKIASIEVTANEFKLVDNTCKTTLKPDQRCDVTIAYSPNKENDLANGLMNISLEDGSNAEVALQGENLSYWDNNWLDDDFDWYTNDADWGNINNDFKFANKNLVVGKKAILEAHLTGPGILSFDFNFTNDTNKNNIIYYVDGQPVRNIKADQKSTNQHSTKISSGEHRVTWVYNKKAGNNGQLTIANLKYKRSATTTPTVVNSLKSSGGGSTGLFFLSGLVLLIGLKKRLNK